MVDFIVVGQGIAGSMLSWFLIKAGQQVVVIDQYNASSASHIASGITNPITGRRFVKSWLADELIPFSEKTYRHFENLFSASFYHSISIIKILDSVKAQNDWSARCALPEYLPYLQNENLIHLDKQKVKNDFGGFEISAGTRLQTDLFLFHYREYLRNQNLLLETPFNFRELKVDKEFVWYQGIQARKIIFCEGASAIRNPYFKFLPFQLAKGECLIVHIQDFNQPDVINSEVLIMPLPQKNHYYIGATHEWYFEDDKPSQQGKDELLGNLSAVLKSPFEIIAHKAAIRPTVNDRRPFLGFHPESNHVGIFNGMGTKGISLAPFFANHFVNHLVHKETLMKEVDIKRFL